MAMTEQSKPIALVSMPWNLAKMPSIQLGSLDAALRGQGLTSERHELFVDFCAQLTPALYSRLANGNDFLIEWLFSRDYFGHETGDWLNDFEAIRPKIDGIQDLDVEAKVIEGVKSAVAGFLDRIENEIDWARYDIVGFSLSTQQLGASIAMARRIKKRWPHIQVIFGGSMCTGDAGPAILALCSYVDVVVRTEGEIVLPELVQRLRSNRSLEGVRGLNWRDQSGVPVAEEDGPLFQNNTHRPFINYDQYFEKVEKYGLMNSLGPMITFESSRGCWWGEKSQCSFCGLHEIMKYRPKQQNFVLDEMEYLAKRHDFDRFYAVDLIAPKEFYQDFFPEIERRGHKWQLFYEIKSNVSFDQLKRFKAGGGKVIQPGIESLQDASLKRMHKGAHVLQNIQLLKWCAQIGVTVYWNYLMSLPGEDASDYDGAADKTLSLLHLEPPTTIRDVLITRYAPYHKTPEKYGVENLRPHRFYQAVFPVEQPILDGVAYLFEAEWANQAAAQNYTAALKEACRKWQKAQKNGARLDATQNADGSITIQDTRSGEARTHRIEPHDAVLYLLMDTKQIIGRLDRLLKDQSPEAYASIINTGGIEKRLKSWLENRLIIREAEQVLNLAVQRGTFDPTLSVSKVNKPRVSHQDVA